MAIYDTGIDPFAPLIDEAGNPAPDVAELLAKVRRLAMADRDIVAAAIAGDAEAVKAEMSRILDEELERRRRIFSLAMAYPEARALMCQAGFRMLPKEARP